MNLNPRLAERLFGENARPHQWIVSTEEDLKDLCTDERIAWLQAFRFGEFVVWGDYLCADGVTPSIGATNGQSWPVHYVYKTAVQELVADAHARCCHAGIRFCGYIHPDRWREQYRAATGSYNGVGRSIIAEVERQAWDGAMIDGSQFSFQRQEVICTLLKLGSDGMSMSLHQSIPGWANPDEGYCNVGLLASLPRYVMTGETNKVAPASLDDPMWRHEIGFNWLGGSTIGMYKPNKSTDQGRYWDEHREEWYPRLPEWGCIARATRWTLEERGTWLTHYWPAYELARREYRARMKG